MPKALRYLSSDAEISYMIIPADHVLCLDYTGTSVTVFDGEIRPLLTLFFRDEIDAEIIVASIQNPHAPVIDTVPFQRHDEGLTCRG